MITFNIISKSLRLRKTLSDVRVASLTKKQYDFVLHFLKRFLTSLKAIYNEWLITISRNCCLFEVFIMKECVEFCLILSSTTKQNWLIKTKEMFSVSPLINNYISISWSFLLLSISGTPSSNTVKKFSIYIIFINIFINITHIIWVSNNLICFKPTLLHLLINSWYFASYGCFAHK